jgi:hypothetical protein
LNLYTSHAPVLVICGSLPDRPKEDYDSTGDTEKEEPVSRALERIKHNLRALVKRAEAELTERSSAATQRTGVSFRYSYRSIETTGDRAHLKASERRFEDGRFEAEDFEGTLEGGAYVKAVQELQRRLVQGMTALLAPIAPPWLSKADERDREDE